MKRKSFSILAATVAVITLTMTALTGKANDAITKLTDIKDISKINATGNVKVYISEGATEGVTVYNEYYSNSALVQEDNGELNITSFDSEQLEIWVQVNKLTRIEAGGNAEIKSLGKFTALELSVELNDSASADLNTQVISFASVVNDSASLKLTGDALDHAVIINGSGKTDVTDFDAISYTLEIQDKGQLRVSRQGKNITIQKPV